MRVKHRQHVRDSGQRQGYVLIAVLIVVVILSLAAYRYSDMTTAEFRATDNILKNAQARALADSGIHYTAAMLSDPTAFAGTLGGVPYSNQAAFGNISLELNNGRSGYFSIMTPDYSQDPTQGSLPLIYGPVDEASKINLNAMMQIDPSGTVAYNSLMLLPNMTSEIANCILDWIDADDDERAGGAESEYYEGLQPYPYRCKNGPLDSIEELLLVQGVTPDLLYGNDSNRNGKLDPDEDPSNGFNPGWAPYLTVYSRERNVDSSGNPRININGKDLSTVYTQLKAALGDQLAAYIIAYRYMSPPSPNAKTVQAPAADLVTLVEAALGGKSPPKSARNIASIYQLFGTVVSSPGGKGQADKAFAFPIKDASTATTTLPTLLDVTSTVADMELPARINVNTASTTVMTCLPGLTATDVSAIIAARPAVGSSDATDPTYQTTAWLYTQANLSIAKMQALDRYITARTQVYRIQSIGYFEKSGPVVRVEAVVDTNNGQPRILYYRDLTELGRAIDPRNN